MAQITVFPECNFIGRAVNLPEGDYTTNELLNRGISDNGIASIIVSEGFATQLYTEDRFGGKSGKLLELSRCLENTRYHNNISSLTVFRTDEQGNALTAESSFSNNQQSTEQAINGIELFTDCYFGGRSVVLESGKFTTAQLRKLGLADNSLSSIRVPKGMKIDMFENDFFRGRSGSLNSNSDCLVERFNDVVSSLIVTGVPTEVAPTTTQMGVNLPPVIVYNRCNYEGQGARLPVGEYLAKDLNALGLADNSIASIRVPAGIEIVVFENDFQRGKSRRVASSARCLRGSQFENTISSINVVQASEESQAPLSTTTTSANNTTDNERVTVFTECNYKGRFAELPTGEYAAAALKSLGFTDNSISAIKVSPSLKVTVYENDLYRGGSLALNDDEPCLVNRRANDAISSLIVETRKSEKPFVTPPTSTDKQQLQQGLNCVKNYVDKKLCTAESWNVIKNFCALKEIDLMSDGYLEGHVNSGNCISEHWPELVKRISNPPQR